MRLSLSFTSAFLALVFISTSTNVARAETPPSPPTPPPAAAEDESYPANAVVKETVTDVRTGEEIKKASGRLRLSTALIVGETSRSSYERGPPISSNQSEDIESKKRHSVSGLQFAVKYEPNEILGTTWEFGLSFQGHVHVNTLELSGAEGDIPLPLRNVYGMVGYKVWRFGGAIGLQFPLFAGVNYRDYDVSPQPGLRLALSADVAPNFSIGGYVGWMGYRFKPDAEFGRVVSVNVGSSGFLVRLTTP